MIAVDPKRLTCLSKVFDHSNHKYLKGYRMLECWPSDGLMVTVFLELTLLFYPQQKKNINTMKSIRTLTSGPVVSASYRGNYQKHRVNEHSGKSKPDKQNYSVAEREVMHQYLIPGFYLKKAAMKEKNKSKRVRILRESEKLLNILSDTSTHLSDYSLVQLGLSHPSLIVGHVPHISGNEHGKSMVKFTLKCTRANREAYYQCKAMCCIFSKIKFTVEKKCPTFIRASWAS